MHRILPALASLALVSGLVGCQAAINSITPIPEEYTALQIGTPEAEVDLEFVGDTISTPPAGVVVPEGTVVKQKQVFRQIKSAQDASSDGPPITYYALLAFGPDQSGKMTLTAKRIGTEAIQRGITDLNCEPSDSFLCSGEILGWRRS